jgi:hypothetical protein
MKIRDNMSAVIEGLQKDHGLLAAYLEATDKIDWRALHKRVLIGEPPCMALRSPLVRWSSSRLSRNAAQIMIGLVAQPCWGMSIANLLELRDDLPKDVGSFARIAEIQVGRGAAHWAMNKSEC